MVQKGKFSAAAWLLVRTLKKVDFLCVDRLTDQSGQMLTNRGTREGTTWASTDNKPRQQITYPTLGSPTMPIFKLVPTLPKSKILASLAFSLADFLGGIVRWPVIGQRKKIRQEATCFLQQRLCMRVPPFPSLRRGGRLPHLLLSRTDTGSSVITENPEPNSCHFISFVFWVSF